MAYTERGKLLADVPCGESVDGAAGFVLPNFLSDSGFLGGGEVGGRSGVAEGRRVAGGAGGEQCGEEDGGA